MIKLFLRYYTPREYLTVDKQLVPFRGCCPFKQYVPSKPDKHEMKFFWICDSSTFYPLKTKPYMEKQENAPQRGFVQDVALDLCTPFNNSGRNIITDNYFSDSHLAVNLLQNGLTLVGTVRTRHLFQQTFFHLVGAKYSHRPLAFKGI